MGSLQAEIQAALRLRAPVTLCGSTERPNLHLSCRVKPSEDVALMASMLTDMLLGQPCSLAQEPVALAPPGCIPATVIYCVSKAEVETMRSVMNADARLRGRVRNCSPGLLYVHHLVSPCLLRSALRNLRQTRTGHAAEVSCAQGYRCQLCRHHRSMPRS